MKILFLCHSLSIGGIETYILRFANWLKQKHPEHELHLACKSGEFGPYKFDFKETDVVLHSIQMGYFNPLQYFQFYRFLKHNHFDAVCDFGGDFGAFPLICASAAKISRRVVFYRNARNPYSHTTFKRLYQSFLNRLVRIFSTHILSNSQDAFDYYYQNYPFAKDSRFQIIRNGIPAGAPLTSDEKAAIRHDIGILPDQKMVLHVGSGRWEKNHKLILNVAKICQDKGDNIRFCLVGPDVEKNYGDEVRKLALNNVFFLGLRRDVGNLLQVADLFLFPSFSEGQPNALLEALMAELPVLASDIGTIKECFPSCWREKFLFNPTAPVQAYLLVKIILNDLKKNSDFRELYAWCKNNYNEDKCFGEFLKILTY